MNAQDKPITPAEDRALEIARQLVVEWNETRRDNLGALIRHIAAVLMEMEAETRGLERAAFLIETDAIYRDQHMSPTLSTNDLRDIAAAIRALT